MNARILIPAGWQRIKRGNIRAGDMRIDPFGPTWEPVYDFTVGHGVFLHAFLIRKTTRRVKR